MPPSSLARLATSLATALAASAAHADTAACDSVLAAMTKLASTPSHQFITTNRNGKSTQGEVVTMGKTRWVLAVGKWHTRPYDAAQETADMVEAARARKSSCERVRSETVDGEAASLVRVRSTGEGSTSDEQVWISTSRGLPLREVIDIDGQQHLEVRFDYAHVAAPAGS